MAALKLPYIAKEALLKFPLAFQLISAYCQVKLSQLAWSQFSVLVELVGGTPPPELPEPSVGVSPELSPAGLSSDDDEPPPHEARIIRVVNTKIIFMMSYGTLLI